MDNPAAASPVILLAGKPHTLNFSRASWAIAEVRLKMPLLSPGCEDFWNNTGTIGQCTVLLYVGMCRANPRLTLDDVAELLPRADEQLTQIAELAKAELPKLKPAQEGEQSADPS